jgi:hypothetical protein
VSAVQLSTVEWSELVGEQSVRVLPQFSRCELLLLEAGNWGKVYFWNSDLGVGSRHQTTAGEGSRRRRLGACCSKLQSVLISDSAIVICSYDLLVNPITNQKLVYSESYTWQYYVDLQVLHWLYQDYFRTARLLNLCCHLAAITHNSIPYILFPAKYPYLLSSPVMQQCLQISPYYPKNHLWLTTCIVTNERWSSILADNRSYLSHSLLDISCLFNCVDIMTITSQMMQDKLPTRCEIKRSRLWNTKQLYFANALYRVFLFLFLLQRNKTRLQEIIISLNFITTLPDEFS